MNRMIVFMPATKDLITPDGYILAVWGKEIQQEFQDLGEPRSTDEYDIDPFLFPISKTKNQILVWEGELEEPQGSEGRRPFTGLWRKATREDLVQADLVL